MNSIGNIFWLLLGGILIAIIYYLVGRIPYGRSGTSWWTAPTNLAVCQW